MAYMINNPSSTSVQKTLPRIQLLCTTHNYSNQLNRQIDSFWSHISTNEWYGEYHLSSVCTLVHCLGRSSSLRASAPSRPLNATSSFNSYSKDDFNYEEQIRLRDFCARLNGRKDTDWMFYKAVLSARSKRCERNVKQHA